MRIGLNWPHRKVFAHLYNVFETYYNNSFHFEYN
jgi:hypothetical protein